MGIYKGKNIEEAIKKGLKDLNVKKERCDQLKY